MERVLLTHNNHLEITENVTASTRIYVISCIKVEILYASIYFFNNMQMSSVERLFAPNIIDIELKYFAILYIYA